ncbi:MAG: hypothetical protein K2Y40_12805 [Reyranella sp.]|nr:hypothetical protein [Reyranella sp.]
MDHIEILPPADTAASKPWEAIPEGEYGIVELFGHTTLVGRITEIERFGSRMLALEPLFNGVMLPAVFHGGAAIYRLTPCSRQVAWERQPRNAWNLPPAIKAILPPEALPAPASATEDPGDDDDEDGSYR